MAPDNVEARPPHKPKLVDPVREVGNIHRQDLAKQVEGLYMSRYLMPDKSELTDMDTRIEWARLMNLPSTPQAAREGVLKLQRLLDSSIDSGSGTITLSPTSPLKFGDHMVSNFLLNVFSRDSSITATIPEERLEQLFTKFAHELYGDANNNSVGVPSKDRVEKVKHHFTNNRLPAAIEFFLVEPSFLPTVPKERPDEK